MHFLLLSVSINQSFTYKYTGGATCQGFFKDFFKMERMNGYEVGIFDVIRFPDVGARLVIALYCAIFI